MWPSEWKHVRSPDVLCRAILDVVHGKPGGADGRIIRTLLRTGARNIDDFKGLGAGDGRLHDSPFRGGWFGWAPFRLAFGERKLLLEQRKTPACMEMRDIVLDCLSISDKMALSFLDSEHSKALYRASIRRRLQRLVDERERGKGPGEESICGEEWLWWDSGGSSCGYTL